MSSAGWVWAFLLSAFCPLPSWGQLDREMREMFQEIRKDLDSDLRSKFDAAIAANTNKIYFSESEFLRFRDSPINPFDGLYELDPEMYRGGIELKFELPSLRNRMIGRNERQNQKLLGSLVSLTSNLRQSVFEVVLERETVALATVVDAHGYLLTKASELRGQERVQLKSAEGELVSANVIRIDAANDLALLETRHQPLRAVTWHSATPQDGEFVVTPGRQGQALALGTYSHGPRPLQASEQAMLGVRPQNAGLGCELVEITSGGAGDKAGLKVGDIVLQLDSQPIDDVSELVNEIRKRRPGAPIELEIMRSGEKRKVRATLAGRSLSPERAARFKMMNRLGAIPSGRSTDFPWVFQHDSPLFPEQCGGPLLDLDGRVIGLNIARQGRIASLAIPAEHIQALLPELLREEIAVDPLPRE